jgi:O-antigen/teichoic acid export membrane protein
MPEAGNVSSSFGGVLASALQLFQRVGGIRWALADQVVVSGSNFVSTILLARALGIEEFGRFVLAWAIIIFMQNLQYAAVSSAMLSIGPKQSAENASSYFGALFIHQVIFGIGSAVLAFAGTNLAAGVFAQSRLTGIASALAVAVLCSQTQDFLRRYFFCVLRPEISVLIDAVRYLGFIVSIFALARLSSLDAVSALWLLSVAAAAGSLAAIAFLPSLRFSLTEVLSHGLHGWHFSKWLVAGTALVEASNNLFYFGSGILLGTSAAGAMKAAFTLASVTNVVNEASLNVIIVGASRQFVSNGRRGLAVYLEKVGLYGAAAVCSLLAVAVVAPKFWLRVLFGPAFEQYWPLVFWAAGYQLLIFSGLIIGTWHRTLESTRFIFYANVLSVAVSLCLVYPLISAVGMTGALVGLVIGQIVLQGFMLISAKLMR